jgi:hypothetical protein
LGEAILNKIERISRKLDELRNFLEDIFLTTKEYILLKEIDKVIKNKMFNELKTFR